MTVITTLDNVEHGQQINVGTGRDAVVWQRDGNEFFRVNNGSVRLRSTYFEGGVRAGIVSTVDTAPLVVAGGMCLRRTHSDERVEFWVVGGVIEGVAYTVHVRTDQTMELSSIQVERLIALEATNVSEEHRGSDRLLGKYLEIATDHANTMRRVKTYQDMANTGATRFDGLVSAVHAWMENGGMEYDSDLDSILEGAGADPRPGQDFTAEVTVCVSGTSEVEISNSDAAAHVGGIDSYDVNDVGYATVEWSTSFTHELESEGGECRCGDMNWDEIARDWASNSGVSYDLLDAEVECDRCG